MRGGTYACNTSRLGVAGALALSVPSLLFSSPALAEAGDEAAVKQNVEALREALLKADKAQWNA